jgi:type IV secretory pathway VirB4 component
MLHLPFLHHQNRGDLVLGRLWKFPISPLFRVTTSARNAHLYVIGMSGKGKSKLLEYCLYQDIAAGRGCGLIDPHSLLVAVLEFVSQYVDLKPTASGAIGPYPFHDDHHPSFGVKAEGNYWHSLPGVVGD